MSQRRRRRWVSLLALAGGCAGARDQATVEPVIGKGPIALQQTTFVTPAANTGPMVVGVQPVAGAPANQGVAVFPTAPTQVAPAMTMSGETPPASSTAQPYYVPYSVPSQPGAGLAPVPAAPPPGAPVYVGPPAAVQPAAPVYVGAAPTLVQPGVAPVYVGAASTTGAWSEPGAVPLHTFTTATTGSSFVPSTPVAAPGAPMTAGVAPVAAGIVTVGATMAPASVSLTAANGGPTFLSDTPNVLKSSRLPPPGASHDPSPLPLRAAPAVVVSPPRSIVPPDPIKETPNAELLPRTSAPRPAPGAKSKVLPPVEHSLKGDALELEPNAPNKKAASQQILMDEDFPSEEPAQPKAIEAPPANPPRGAKPKETPKKKEQPKKIDADEGDLIKPLPLKRPAGT